MQTIFRTVRGAGLLAFYVIVAAVAAVFRPVRTRVGAATGAFVGAFASLFQLTRSVLDLPTFHEKRSIILRKVRGVSGSAALFRQDRGAAADSGFSLGGFLGAFASIGAIALIGLVIGGTLMLGMGAHSLHAAARTGSPVAFAVAGNLAAQVKDKQDQLAAKQKKLHEVFEASGTDIDFTKPAVLELLGAKTSVEAVEKVRAMNAEMDAVGKEITGLSELKGIQEANDRRRTEPVDTPPLPGEPTKGRILSLGEVLVGSEAWKNKGTRGAPATASLEKGFGLRELKATFLTSAGWAPESLRTGLVVEKATRPIQVLDIIPQATTDMAAVKFMEETTRTDAGAERAENASYAESAYALTERSETVRSIGESVPVSDEQLDDVAGSQSYLEQRLGFGVRQRLDGQVVIGDGNAPNLTGIKNKAGIQTQAKGVDPAPDAIYKAMVLVRVTGRAFPNAAILHPNNWQTIRLLRTADGIYIWGSPSDTGIDRIWGVQVVQSDADAAGTAYVGDYANFCALYERKGLEVAIGYVNNDFLQGRRTIRAGLRVAFAIYRASAFCTVTGLL